MRNQSQFYDRLDAVVLLSAPADVILDRIARRTTNNYGKTPLERAMIVDDLASVEPLLRAAARTNWMPVDHSMRSSPT